MAAIALTFYHNKYPSVLFMRKMFSLLFPDLSCMDEAKYVSFKFLLPEHELRPPGAETAVAHR